MVGFRTSSVLALLAAVVSEGSSHTQPVERWEGGEPSPRGAPRNFFGGREDDDGGSSWSLAAFRAFHEMRAGPVVSYPPDGLDEKSGATATPLSGDEEHRLKRPWKKMPMALQKAFNLARENRAGEESNAENEPIYWHMRGRLTNASTGRTIALVEGVEVARSLRLETRHGSRVAADKGGVEGMVPELPGLDKALSPGLWQAFGTLVSSKFYIYQNPETGEPMSTFQHTPVSQKMPVRPFEHFTQAVSHVLQRNGRVLVISEWAGSTVKAETLNGNCVEELEGGRRGWGSREATGGGGLLSLLPPALRPSSDPRRVFTLQFFVQARTTKEERDREQRRNRPSSRWVSFGSTPPPSPACKESYTYVTGQTDLRKGKGGAVSSRGGGKGNTIGEGTGNGGLRGKDKRGGKKRDWTGEGGALMTYTRYGECPAWYGAGRMCSLDIHGRQVESFRSFPSKLRRVIEEVCPGLAGEGSELPTSLGKWQERAERELEARRRDRQSGRWRNRRMLWGRRGRGREEELPAPAAVGVGNGIVEGRVDERGAGG